VDGGDGGLEVYTAGEARYVTITGKQMPGCWPQAADISGVARKLVANGGKLNADQASLPADPAPHAKPFEPAPPYLPTPGPITSRMSLTAGDHSLGRLIRDGVPEGDRSEQFYHAVGLAKRARWTPDTLEAEMRRHPDGIASKYLQPQDRLKAEIMRAWGKVEEAGGSTANKGSHSGAVLAERHPMLEFVPFDETLRAPRFIVPNFIGTGICVIAGYQGIGKTTAVLPLATIVAGINKRLLCPLTPRDWRHVVYITEDIDQAQRILLATANGDSHAIGMIKERVHLVNARRLSADFFAEVGKDYAAMFTRHVEGVALPPLVVIDTKSAAFDVDDENDNAEAARIMSELKQKFAGLPVWLIGHIAKANMTRTTAAEMSMRGASAIEADAHQVVFLVAEKDARFLVRGKTRFEAPFKELAVNTMTDEKEAVNEYGEKVSITVRAATFEPLVPGARQKREQEFQNDTVAFEKQARRKSILQIVREARERGETINRDAVAVRLGGKKAVAIDEVKGMIDEDLVAEVEIPKKHRTHPNRKFLLIDLEPDERNEYRATGRVPQVKLEQVAAWARVTDKEAAPAEASNEAESAEPDPNKVQDDVASPSDASPAVVASTVTGG
jgi:hypothetical protein